MEGKKYFKNKLKNGGVWLELYGKYPCNRVHIIVENGLIKRIHQWEEVPGNTSKKVDNPCAEEVIKIMHIISEEAIIDLAELLSKEEPLYNMVISELEIVRKTQCERIKRLNGNIQRIDAILEGST